MRIPFVSLGYDYIRIYKALSEGDIQYLKSNCTFRNNKWHLNKNNYIAFQLRSQQVTLCICPAKLLRYENVELASPEEVKKALNKVQREIGFDFSDGRVCELHITMTVQIPEPFLVYRSMIRAPKQYRYEEQKDGDYYNGANGRLIMLVYNKTKEWKGKYPEPLQSQFTETFTPELFRAELKLNKSVRQTLGKFWDKNKYYFLASDLTDEKTFLNLARYYQHTFNRFMKKVENPIPSKIKSENAIFRLFSASERRYAAHKELFEQGILSPEMFRRATKYYNEAREHERSEYIRKQLSEKISSLIQENGETPELNEKIKRALDRLGRGKIFSLPPKRRVLL